MLLADNIWAEKLLYEFAASPKDFDCFGLQKDADVSRLDQVAGWCKQIEFLIEDMPDEKVRESAFEVLKYGKQKELRIRDLFSRLMSFVGDQRSVDSGQNLSNNYLRPYSKRRNFSLEQRPKYLPFEIFAYFRNHWTLELEEVDDPKINEMRQM